ncbi:MAG: polysaccharide deacetylase family protein [Chloroflexota bacterium]
MAFITSLLHHFYDTMQRRYPSVLWHGDESAREIALTFDDGPHPRDTLLLLHVLEKHKVRATFHVVGKSAERYPELIRQIHERGHQLALHCYRHVPFPLENTSTLRAQLERTSSFIADACGLAPETIKDLRPPYGVFTKRTLSLLAEWGYRLVMWNSIPPHWMQPFSWSLRQMQDSIVPGAVIALHDGHRHGSRVAQIVDIIVPRAMSLGFEFVTVEKMQDQREQLAALS